MRDNLRELKDLIDNEDLEEVDSQFRKTVKIIDKCASKGIIHENKAARKKSHFAKRINKLKENE